MLGADLAHPDAIPTLESQLEVFKGGERAGCWGVIRVKNLEGNCNLLSGYWGLFFRGHGFGENGVAGYSRFGTPLFLRKSSATAGGGGRFGSIYRRGSGTGEGEGGEWSGVEDNT